MQQYDYRHGVRVLRRSSGALRTHPLLQPELVRVPDAVIILCS